MREKNEKAQSQPVITIRALLELMEEEYDEVIGIIQEDSDSDFPAVRGYPKDILKQGDLVNLNAQILFISIAPYNESDDGIIIYC